MASNRPSVIVGISDHWILGQLPAADTRIQDRLNDSRSDFIELAEVEVHLCTERQCVRNLSRMVISKSKIMFLAAQLQQHEAPDERLNHFAKKKTFEAFAALSHYRISGDLHLPTHSANTVHALSNQLSRFFPVTDAVVNGRGVSELSVPLLIVNKDHVDGFHVGEETNRERDCEKGALERLYALIEESSGDHVVDDDALAIL